MMNECLHHAPAFHNPEPCPDLCEGFFESIMGDPLVSISDNESGEGMILGQQHRVLGSIGNVSV